MRYRLMQPSPELSHIVESVWSLEDDGLAEPEGIERIVPDGRMEFIVVYGPAFEQDIEGAGRGRAPVIVAGQLSKALLLPRTGAAAGMISARLKPAAGAAFVRAAAGELTDRVFAADGFELGATGALADEIASAESFEDRARILLSYVAGVLGAAGVEVSREPSRAELAVRRIEETGGLLSVFDIARSLFVTTRTLEREFYRSVGLTPKQFSRIVRFQSVLREHSLSFDSVGGAQPYGPHEGGKRRWTWASLAATCGYSDQSHLVRDFVHYTGQSPMQFMRERTPITEALVEHLASSR